MTEYQPRPPKNSSTFSTGYVELAAPLCLPGVMCHGRPQSDISLYQYICTQLCAFIASYPAQHFTLCVSIKIRLEILARFTYSAVVAVI